MGQTRTEILSKIGTYIDLMPDGKSVSLTAISRELSMHPYSLLDWLKIMKSPESFGNFEIIESSGNRIQILKRQKLEDIEEIRNEISTINIKLNKILQIIDKKKKK